MGSKAIVVIGGGISGLTAALEAAEVGHEVFIVEKNPFLGGRVMQLSKYFPKLCPPSCGLEIQFQRIKNNKLVKFFTGARVTKVTGSAGNYSVTVSIQPRFVEPGSVDLSGAAAGLSQDVKSGFELGLGTRKALYMDVPFAFPHRYVLEKEHCTKGDLETLAGVDGIDLDEAPREVVLTAGAIIYATGWKPYDVTRLTNLGAGAIPNCITNLQFERLAAPSGPTAGRILRPSDGRPPRSVAFVQCAGSRDENHLNYCSAICCMASLKQATFIRDAFPDARVTIYYIDLRAPGRYDTFAKRILSDERVNAVKGKVAAVTEAAGSGDVILTVENALDGIKSDNRFEMAVLATGMQPSLAGERLPVDLPADEMGFLLDDEERGIFVAGCAKTPLDVMKSAQSATGAAMKAVALVRGR